jgi:hypothetical protein
MFLLSFVVLEREGKKYRNTIFVSFFFYEQGHAVGPTKFFFSTEKDKEQI